jgi:hypothetical protein
VSRSRSLVGSSSTSRFGLRASTITSCSRRRSPPDSIRTGAYWAVLSNQNRSSSTRSSQSGWRSGPATISRTIASGSSSVGLLVGVADDDRRAAPDLSRRRARHGRRRGRATSTCPTRSGRRRRAARRARSAGRRRGARVLTVRLADTDRARRPGCRAGSCRRRGGGRRRGDRPPGPTADDLVRACGGGPSAWSSAPAHLAGATRARAGRGCAASPPPTRLALGERRGPRGRPRTRSSRRSGPVHVAAAAIDLDDPAVAARRGEAIHQMTVVGDQHERGRVVDASRARATRSPRGRGGSSVRRARSGRTRPRAPSPARPAWPAHPTAGRCAGRAAAAHRARSRPQRPPTSHRGGRRRCRAAARDPGRGPRSARRDRSGPHPRRVLEPARMRSSVDFPEPLTPTMATRSPDAMVTDRSRRAPCRVGRCPHPRGVDADHPVTIRARPDECR